MRELIVKWEGECKRCGAPLEVGTPAMYEKSMGIFCIGHEPTEVEEIREYRTIKAEAKAARLDEWAQKREGRANDTLNHIREHYRGDFAFNTQPGHIPERSRVIRQEDRAFESLAVAERLRNRAEGIRNGRVAGDAERKRQAMREALDKRIFKGSRVADIVFGDGEVVGVYSKSYRIKFDRGCTYSRDKSYILPLGVHK